MTITAYRTNLDPDHVTTVLNVNDYLATLEYNTFTIRDVNAGAETLIIELPRTGYELYVYNYFVVSGYHYFGERDVVTKDVYRYTLTRDYWGDLSQIRFCGTLTRGHVLASYSSYFVNPVTLTGGSVINANSFDDDTRTYLLVALTYDLDDEEAAALVIVPSATISEDITVSAEHIVANVQKWALHEVLSVVGAWRVPISVLPTLTDADFHYIMQYEYGGALTYEVMTATFKGRTVKSETITLGGNRDDVLMVGNFGNLTEIPFEGRTSIIGKYDTVVDWDGCGFYATVSIGAQVIDLSETARQAIISNRVTSTDAENNTNTILGTLTSAVAVVGGIATMNPMAVAGGIMGGAATIANAFTRQSAHHSVGQSGDARSNYSRGGHTTGLCGTVLVRATNRDANIAELIARGFSGAINVFDTGAGLYVRIQNAISANGTYMLMSDARVMRENVDEKTARTIEQTLQRGTTIYTDYNTVGQPIVYTGFYG